MQSPQDQIEVLVRTITSTAWRAMAAVGVLAFAGLSAAAQKPVPPYAVAGYVFPRNRLLAPNEVHASALTRIYYAFAAIQNGRLVEGPPLEAQNLAQLTGLRKQNPSLQVLVSVGGWGGSGEFSNVALTAESRAKFASSAVDFLRRHNLDGLDVDWESPGMPGAGHVFRPEDKQNFTLLLQELRARFDQEQKPPKRRWLLTIAAGASTDYLAHTEMDKVQRYVDAVNLMSYDYAVPSAGALTGHNAPLFTNPAAPSQQSADVSVRAFERAGVPSRKILLGVPFYSRVWMQVPDRNHGLFQPGKPSPDDFAPFSAIAQKMLGHGFTRYWDKTAEAPYLYNPATQEFVSCDDAASLEAKCAYVKTHRLGGIMFWEYLDDPSGELVTTMDRALDPPAKATGACRTGSDPDCSRR